MRPSIRSNLSKRRHDHAIYPYLLTNVTATHPNQIWAVDITYIKLRQSWMYLVAFLDWYSRYVISWQIDDTLELPFVVDALQRALGVATPTICNSDQGSQFTSPQYLRVLEDAGVRISMDGKGRAFDNIFVERLWRSVKYEEVYLADYQSPRDVQVGLGRYFQFYNEQRPHQSLAYQRPAAVYFGT